MNRKQNFIAIFAIALIAIGANLLTSCNADDEEYDFNGVYTMANGMKTRSGEQNYSGTEDDKPSTFYRGGTETLIFNVSQIQTDLCLTVTWGAGLWSEIRPEIRIDSVIHRGTYFGEIFYEGKMIDMYRYEFESLYYDKTQCVMDKSIDTDLQIHYTETIDSIGANGERFFRRYTGQYTTANLHIDLANYEDKDN